MPNPCCNLCNFGSARMVDTVQPTREQWLKEFSVQVLVGEGTSSADFGG